MMRTSDKEYDISTIPPSRNAYISAAYVAHPHLDIPENLVNEKMSISEVKQVLVTNKVLFRSFIQYDSAPSFRKKDVISRLICNSKESSHYYDFYKVVKNELLSAIELLNSYGVQTLFIKSSKILPLDSDNFDVLVHVDQMQLADQVLKRNGFSVVKCADEPYKVLYRKTKNGKDYLALHLHTKIAWYGVEFLKAEDIWKKYLVKNIEGTNIGFISPEHHVLVTLAHALFENASMKLGDIMYLVDSFGCKDLDISSMLFSSMAMRWDVVFYAMLLFGNTVHHDIYGLPIIPENKLDTVFLDTLSQEKRKKIKKLYKRMNAFYEKPYLPVPLPLKNYRRKQIISKVIFNESFSLMDKAKKLRYFFSLPLKGVLPTSRPAPSVLVAIIGVDGTGKTTHARMIADDFRKRGYAASYIWTRGSFRLSKPLLALAITLLKPSSSTKIHKSASNVKRRYVKPNSLLGKILTILLIFEHATQIRSELFLRKFSSNAIIFDRYLHDTLVDSLCNYSQDNNRFFSKLLLNTVELFAPKPDLIVLLETTPYNILRRRPEEDLETIKLKSQIYKLWSKRWSAYVLDTEQCTIKRNHLKLLEKTLRLFYEERTEELL